MAEETPSGLNDALSVRKEVYNGVRNVLLQPRYNNHVTAHTIERLTVILCSLALASHRPDYAVYHMLARLASPAPTGLLAEAVEQELRDVLRGKSLLSADSFNELLDDFQNGPANLISRPQYLPIYEHLKRVHSMTNRVLADATYLADSTLNWARARGLMQAHSIPLVKATGGAVVPNVDSINAVIHLSDWLTHIWRVVG